MRFILILSLLCFALRPALAQDTIAEKMSWLAKAKSTSNFFVHFDKNVYTNNEIAYFTGYLIKEGATKVSNHQIMSVCLVRDLDSAIIIQDKFVMGKGLSFGSITLPDSILTGNYHFIAYTDQLINGLPSAIFYQSITIKTNIDPAFKASLKVLDATKENSKNHQVLLAVTTKDNRFLPKPTQINYRYGNLSKKTKTDPSGQLLISLPEQSNLTDPNLYVKLKNDKDSSYLNLALPLKKNKASIGFYPEGGSLVLGLSSNIGWEVKDQQKMPVAVKAFLYENNEVIDTVETSSYGIGKFLLLPKRESTYSIKLIHSGLADSIYYLPKAIEKGFVLNLKSAIVRDTLSLSIKTTGTKNLNFLLHNFRQMFSSIPFDMETNRRMIKIPLDEVPKGLVTLTVLDSLNRPLAERIFFAHYDNEEKITTSTDKQIYNQREKVTLNLKLNLDTISLVSIACIQDNRLEIKKINDIESYTYLTSELNALPVVLKGTPFKDKNYLEQVLLVKGWRKYTWQDLQTTTASDIIAKKDSLQMLGSITKSKKDLVKPVTIGAFGDNKIRLINTSEKGSFNFNVDELILEQGKKSVLFINDKNKFDYKIQIYDQFLAVDEKLSKSLVFENPVLPSTIVNNAELVLKGNEKAIRLKEVVIKSRKDNGISYRGASGSNACGDYVCRYNILNCRNHPGDADNTQPVAGRSYMTNGISMIYQECRAGLGVDENFLKFNGIHQPKEFYHNDYKDPQEPAFFSTIYWNYGMMLTNKKETELNFYTSDITGKFKIIVQGVTNKGVVYSENFFEVKPSK
ncbi:hypothetical protein [Pedobacter frigiditerrae]|uniref:hypothetical protein n=1 Tax=Pedobacter frigiditerrae TaxID=2530452 RepID=UPI00292E7FE8|nr:hypothetical protein [Pedobacter frigiditerrae]